MLRLRGSRNKVTQKGYFMANKTPKTIKASKKSFDNLHQAHGALQPAVDMDEMFGIRSPYVTETGKDIKKIEDYQEFLGEMSITDLQAHAHSMGVIPLDSKERLVNSLERKFVEYRTSKVPHTPIPVKINPKFAKFARDYHGGNL